MPYRFDFRGSMLGEDLTTWIDGAGWWVVESGDGRYTGVGETLDAAVLDFLEARLGIRCAHDIVGECPACD